MKFKVAKMTFKEKAQLHAQEERKSLLRDPVWSQSHRYGRMGLDPEMDEILGLDAHRNQRFQWLLFLAVTFLSLLILLSTMVVLIKLSQSHPAVEPKTRTTSLSPVLYPNLPSTSPPNALNATSTPIVTPREASTNSSAASPRPV